MSVAVVRWTDALYFIICPNTRPAPSKSPGIPKYVIIPNCYTRCMRTIPLWPFLLFQHFVKPNVLAKEEQLALIPFYLLGRWWSILHQVPFYSLHPIFSFLWEFIGVLLFNILKRLQLFWLQLETLKRKIKPSMVFVFANLISEYLFLQDLLKCDNTNAADQCIWFNLCRTACQDQNCIGIWVNWCWYIIFTSRHFKLFLVFGFCQLRNSFSQLIAR